MNDFKVTQNIIAKIAQQYKYLLSLNKITRQEADITITRIAKEHGLRPIYLW